MKMNCAVLNEEMENVCTYLILEQKEDPSPMAHMSKQVDSAMTDSLVKQGMKIPTPGSLREDE